MSSAARAAPTRSVWAALAALIALIAVCRVHTYDEPVERDIATYAVFGHELLAGRALYSDLWEHRPPGAFLTYAAAELLVGYGPRALYLLNVVFGGLILLGAYSAGAAGAGTRAGLWAAAFWALASGDLFLQGNQPNTELFMNACLVWAFALMLELDDESESPRLCLAIGLCLSAATLYKPVAAAAAGLLIAAHLSASAGERGFLGLRQAFSIGAAAAAPWILLIGYYLSSADFAAFYGANVAFNRHYAGDVIGNVLASFNPEAAVPQAFWSLLPLAAAALAGTVRGLWLGERRWILLAAFLLAAQLQMAMPGQYQFHYYQLWLPPLAIGAAWSGELLGALGAPRRRLFAVLVTAAAAACWAGWAAWRWHQGPLKYWPPLKAWMLLPVVAAVWLPVILESRRRRRPELPALFGVLLAGVLAWREGHFYRLPASGWPKLKYRHEYYPAAKELGLSLRSVLAADETFYHWGDEAGLYFYSGKRPPTGVLHLEQLFRGPVREELTRRVSADLERERPALLVVSRSSPSRHPVISGLWDDYRSFRDNDLGHFILFVRRDSPLETRLRDAGVRRSLAAAKMAP